MDMSPIRALPALRELHLCRNRIQTVCGLEGCGRLATLHLADQRLPAWGGGVAFDPRATAAVARSLEVLYAPGNAVEDFRPLCGLHRLVEVPTGI